jgi:GAF domain-containing protein
MGGNGDKAVVAPPRDAAKRTFPFAGKSNSLGAKRKSAEASAMSLTRKAPTATKKDDKPGRQELVQALAEREAELAEARRQNSRLFDEIQAKTRDLEESLQQQTATAGVLKVISRSAFDLQTVLNTLVRSAVSLCDASGGMIYLKDGDAFYGRAFAGYGEQFIRYLESNPQLPGRRSVGARVLLTGEVQNIPDPQADSEYDRHLLATTQHRAVLGVPLLRDQTIVGAIVVGRQTPEEFTQREIELVQTFADQAVIAIENVRLFDEVQAKTRDLEEALQQQTATANVLKVISRSAFDLQAVLDTLVRSVAELSDSSSGVIYLQDENAFHIKAHFGMRAEFVRYLEQNPQQPGRGSVGGRVLLTGAVQNIPDAQADQEYDPVLKSNPTTRALLGVPLLRDGKIVGAIFLARGRAVPFSQRQIELVQTFADQAVIAIENVRLFDEVQARTRALEESLQQQTATADVLKVISRTAFDLQAVFETLLDSAIALSGAWQGTICIRDGVVCTYRAVRTAVGTEEFDDQIRTRLLNREAKADRTTLAGRAILSGKVEQIEDIFEDPEYWLQGRAAETAGIRAVLGVPLLRNDRAEGALVLSRRQPGRYSPRVVELVRTFADQAVIAIENARLFDEVQARTRDLEESLTQQTATADVLKAISRSAFDLDTVLETLIATALRLCDATYGEIFRRHGDLYRYAASRMDVDPAYLHHERAAEIAPGRGTLVGRVALENRAVEIVDAWNDPEYAEKEEARIGNVRAMLGVPLMRDGEMIGAFALARAEAIPFSQRQVDLVATFADQAVIAIENVRLFEEVQAKTRDLEESLQQQTATADVLKVISRSAFDLQAVFDALISSAVNLIGSQHGTIYVREGDSVRIRAHCGVAPEFVDFLVENPPVPGMGSASGRVMLTGKVVVIPDILEDKDYTLPANELNRTRAMLGAPLLRNDRVEGVLVIARTEPGPFSSRQVELVETFADQAVIAIENARLFDEVQAKTRDLEESLQQQTATADVLKVISRSAFDLQAVLTTLSESARELCGASFVTLFMRDGDEMRLRAESGCTREIVQFLRAHPIRAGRETFTGRVMLSGEAVHLPDVLADPEYDFGDAPRIGDYRALLGVPLLRDGQVEGVFALARPEPRPFSARQIEMVRAFADQAVIAIENARLFDEVQARTRELAASLDDLRKAQDRLIQSEKLASLGQLTAGIAHEIKNPLNFINNYSALSRELIDELAEAIKDGAVDEATDGEADELIGAIGGNLDKILQHGKRADSIVKNMLLHSREGSGERATTNVNAMVEEALNLAYHGARAEKPGFNVTIVKSLDPNAGAAEVYAQEMTRVLLNLISNGFYATSKRKQSAGDGAYEPTISASTRDLGLKVEIAIRDNGAGIPDEVKAKMFNPFFTTKPAGEGTGLGLSLSHDIVVKQHGGAIEVSTEPDVFTEFSIVLPRGAVEL